MRSTLGLGGGVPETVEQFDLLVGIVPQRIVGGQVGNELADPRTELVGEVRSGGADEGVDLGTRWSGAHRRHSLVAGAQRRDREQTACGSRGLANRARAHA